MSNKRKFTLIEVVVALGLLALLATLSIAVLQSSQRLWASVRTESGKLDELQNIDRIANHCIKNIIPFNWLDAENKEREIFKGDSSSIIFAYLHRAHGAESSAIRFVQLKTADNKLIACYRKTPFLHWLGEPVDDESTTKEVIAEGIDSISFEYAEREGDLIVWYQTWNEEAMKQIPLAIFMKIKFTDGTEDLWLRRTAGSGFSTSLGKREINQP